MRASTMNIEKLEKKELLILGGKLLAISIVLAFVISYFVM